MSTRMAASRNPQLVFLVVLVFSAISVHARPCKTFLISSYSFSTRTFRPNFDLNPNFITDTIPTTRFVTIVTEFPGERLSEYDQNVDDLVFVDRQEESRPLDNNLGHPFGIFPGDANSIRARAKDIVSVVAALLFGVGCGALTASTMYLVWSLFSNRDDYESEGESEDEDDSDNDLFSPKKMGYVKISTPDTIPEPVKQAV